MTISLRSINRDESGVTMVELMIVVVIIAIVATFALMQRGSANEVFKRQNVAQQLKQTFERARFDSVKRRAVGSGQEAKVTLTPTSYTLRTYKNDVNGTAVAADLVTTLPAGIVIGNYDGTTLTSIVVTFNMRGETPTSPSPQFYVCNTNCSSPTNAKANLLIVTPTGTVNLLPGGSSLPTFGVPSMTNVNTSTGINPDAIVP